MTGPAVVPGISPTGVAAHAMGDGLARASAPGKLILMGEHCVVYGHPAVAASVQQRLSVAAARAGGVEAGPLPGRDDAEPAAVLTLAGSAPVRIGWREAVRLRSASAAEARKRYGASHLAVAALGEAGRLLGGTPPAMSVEVRSEIPAGHGMGSSAALALAVIAAVMHAAGEGVDRVKLEAAAHEVERRQHGSPSGIDAATVLRGGVVHAVPATKPGGKDGMRFLPLAAAPEALSRFRVLDSGCPVHGTGEVVAAVRRRLQEDPSLEQEVERMGQEARHFADVLVTGDDPAVVRDIIRRFERGLEVLGVVPPSIVRVIRRIEAEGGAAKISGAGGLCDGRDGRPGGGMILVHHPEPERIAGWSFLDGLRPVNASLGGTGLEVS